MGLCQWNRSAGQLECVNCGRILRTASRTAAVRCPRGDGEVIATAMRRAGPGTQLKAILAGWPFHITPRPGCRCNEYAALMDAWGPEECQIRRDEIVGWLRDEATSRGLPFVDAAGQLLLRRAIAKAKSARHPLRTLA